MSFQTESENHTIQRLKNFTNELFRRDLLRQLSFQKVQPNEFDKFKFIASKPLNSHATLKEKYIRYNQAVLMNKELHKAIMTRKLLLNKLRKFNCPENQLAYKRQSNYCVKLLKRSKKDFYNNLNVKIITDNKHFWKTIKSNFTDKILKDEKIVLVEDDKVTTGEMDLAKTFKDHFENIVESLHIERLCRVDFDREPVVNAIKNFSQHRRILKIRENTNSFACFSFRAVSKENLLYQLNRLDPTKATQKYDIPTIIIKKNYDILLEFLFAYFNDIILTSRFPEQLKYADVKPAFKKDPRNDEIN